MAKRPKRGKRRRGWATKAAFTAIGILTVSVVVSVLLSQAARDGDQRQVSQPRSEATPRSDVASAELDERAGKTALDGGEDQELQEHSSDAQSVEDARARFDAHLARNEIRKARDVLSELRGLEIEDDDLLLAEARVLSRQGSHRRLLRLIDDRSATAPTIRADLAVLAADAHYFLDDTNAARRALNTALRADPRHPEALRALARLNMAEERWDAAYDAIRAVLADNPSDAVTLTLLGNLELDRDRENAAFDTYSQALALDPNAAEALWRRALISLHRRDLNATQRDLRRARELDEQSRFAARVALVMHLNDDRERATNFINSTLNRDSKNALARYVAGLLAMRGDRPETARSILATLQDAHKQIPAVARVYGMALLHTGDSAEGRRLIGIHLQDHPRDIAFLAAHSNARDSGLSFADAAWLNQQIRPRREADAELAGARDALDRGDLQEATQTLEQLSNHGVAAREAQQLLAVARLRVGDTSGAHAVAERLIESDSDDALAWQLAGLALRTTNPSSAGKALARASELAPGEPTLAVQLASLSIGRGDEVAARQYFEQALMFNPGDSQLLFALALFAARTGDDDARRDYMEKALRYRPDSLPLRVELAREYLRQGDRDSALGLAATAPQRVPKVYRATRYRIESMAGDWEAAAEHARWLTETDPEKQHFWLWRAEAEGRTGNPAALRSALIRAIKLDRQNKLKPNHLARLVLRSGDRGQIEATLAELRTQLPADPRIMALGESPLLAPDRLKRLNSKTSPAAKPPRDQFVELDLAQVMAKFSDRRFSDLEDIDQDGVADLIRDNPWDSSREKLGTNDVLGSLVELIELEETGIGLLDTPSARP